MRSAVTLERGIILILAVAALAVAGYYLVTSYGLSYLSDDGREVALELPTAAGLAVGQPVMAAGAAGAGTLGTIAEMRGISTGVLVTVRLDRGIALARDARAILKPGAPPKPARLEIASSPPGGEALSCPARLPAEVAFRAPEGMVEPSPQWPVER